MSTPAPPETQGGLCCWLLTTGERDLCGLFPPRTAPVVWASDGHLYSQVYDVFLAPAVNYFFFPYSFWKHSQSLAYSSGLLHFCCWKEESTFFSYYLLACTIVRGTAPGRGTLLWAALGKHSRNDSDSPHHRVLAIQTAMSVKEFERRDVTQAKGRMWQFANTEWVAWFFIGVFVL